VLNVSTALQLLRGKQPWRSMHGDGHVVVLLESTGYPYLFSLRRISRFEVRAIADP